MHGHAGKLNRTRDFSKPSTKQKGRLKQAANRQFALKASEPVGPASPQSRRL
jgi:hypothetical protein